MKEWAKIVYQEFNYPVVKWCVDKGITANQATIFNHIITLTFGCFFFSRGSYWGWICGLIVCLVNGFIDYLDGDIARMNKSESKLGVWLDSGFDVIVQNAVMGAIAVGCFKMGLPLVWIVLFFIGNAANNFVSFNYNHKFGFDSANGNNVFIDIMNKKPTQINIFFKNLIDPTTSHVYLFIYTLRYWIAIGAVFNIMPMCFIVMTIIGNIKWAIMYMLYALHLAGEKRLYVLQALARLDDEREEYYELRNSKKV